MIYRTNTSITPILFIKRMNNLTNDSESITIKAFNYNILSINGSGFNTKKKEQTIEEFILSHHNGHEIINNINNMTNITDINILSNLKVQIIEMKHLYRRDVLGVIHCYSFRPDEDILFISDRIDLLTKSDYDPKITFDRDEVNGYKLNKSFTVGYDIFIEWKKIWDDKEEMTYEKFKDEFNGTACSDWAKMDKYGECYGGYWKYPDDSYEKENAWELSHEENCKALFDLPYPKRFILYTIDIGCSNRQESVPYTNLLCEYMVQQTLRLSNPKSLKNLCAKTIINNRLNYKKLPKDLIEYYGFNKLYKFNTLKPLKDLCAKTIIKNKLNYLLLPKELVEQYGFDKRYKIRITFCPVENLIYAKN